MKRHNYIIDWFYEPRTFYFEGIKRGTTNYKPDFKVIFPSGNEEWIEVKGYMDAKSATKIKRMAKYFPEIKLRVVDGDWFKTNALMLKKVLKNNIVIGIDNFELGKKIFIEKYLKNKNFFDKIIVKKSWS